MFLEKKEFLKKETHAPAVEVSMSGGQAGDRASKATPAPPKATAAAVSHRVTG